MCSSDPELNATHLLDKDMEDMCASKLEKLCTPYLSVSCACCSMLNLRACANSSSSFDSRTNRVGLGNGSDERYVGQPGRIDVTAF